LLTGSEEGLKIAKIFGRNQLGGRKEKQTPKPDCLRTVEIKWITDSRGDKGGGSKTKKTLDPSLQSPGGKGGMMRYRSQYDEVEERGKKMKGKKPLMHMSALDFV